MLKTQQEIGFGGSSSRTVRVEAHQTDMNLRTYLLANSTWQGNSKFVGILEIATGIDIYGVSGNALDILSADFPGGLDLKIVLEGTADIIGKSSSGTNTGTAIYTELAIEIDNSNSGRIYGGGGNGGAGGAASGGTDDGDAGCGTCSVSGGAGGAGGDRDNESGDSGTSGTTSGCCVGGTGGNGGAIGVAGDAGAAGAVGTCNCNSPTGSPGSGGADAGYYVDGYSLVTWTGGSEGDVGGNTNG